MCKVLLAVFLALSLATAATTPLDDGFVLTERLLPTKKLPLYNTAFDDDQRGFKAFFVAIHYVPLPRDTLVGAILPVEIHRHFHFANSSTAKLNMVLLI